MAQDGLTDDGPDRARSPWERSALPRSPWQADGGAPTGTASEGFGDVIELSATDGGGVIDLGSAAPSPPVVAVTEDQGRTVEDQREPGRSTPMVIDLGEQHGKVAADGAPVEPPPWRRADWHRRIRPVVIAIVVLALFVIGGSVAPLPARLARLSSISVPLGGSLAVEGTRAVVLGSRDSVGESIAAYNVAGGRRDWFTELPIRQSDDVGMEVTDGVIIVSTGRLGTRGPHTVVVDEKTGHLLWSASQDVVSPWRGSDTVLMSGSPNDVMVRDKRTGAPRWELSMPPGCSYQVAVPGAPEVPTALVEICLRQAQLSRINVHTGKSEVTRSIELNADEDVDVTMFTVDDVVVVEDAGIKPPDFHTYKLDDLTPIWTTRGATENVGSYACGVEVCESAAGTTVILDAHTGAVIPTTGHEAQLSPNFQPFINKTDIGTLLLAAPGATIPVVSKTTYVAQSASDETVVPTPLYRPGRTWIVTLSPSGVRDAVQLLVGPAADVCRPIGSYLGCMTAKQTMTFWTLPTFP